MARRAPLASQGKLPDPPPDGSRSRRRATQPIVEAAAAAGFELRVQLLEGRRPRQRHQIVAPGIADQILDLALVVAFARAAEAILE
jgi:hypothetical protein